MCASRGVGCFDLCVYIIWGVGVGCGWAVNLMGLV